MFGRRCTISICTLASLALLLLILDTFLYKTHNVAEFQNVFEQLLDSFDFVDMRSDTSTSKEKPFPYLSNFQNPCWYEDVSELNITSTGQDVLCKKLLQCRRLMDNAHRIMKNREEGTVLRCLPYFFIIGPQKCGTTDLYEKMMMHQNLVPPATKEPHYWTWYKPDNISIVPYVELFDSAALEIEKHTVDGQINNYITGEGSATTIWDNWQIIDLPENRGHSEIQVLVPHYIHDVLPTARIIVIVRDPVKRLISDFLYFGHSDSDVFEERIAEGIAWLTDCFSKHSRRVCMYSKVAGSPRGGHWQPVVRLRLGMYSEFLEDWFNIFPREQILVIRMEDYAQERMQILNEVFTFLHLEPMDQSIADRMQRMSVSNKVSSKKYEMFGRVSEKTMDALYNFYKPYNEKLAKLLNNEKYSYT